MTASYTELFDRDLTAFQRRDANAISAFYEFPMMFIDHQGKRIEFSENDFYSNSERLLALYQQLGVANIEFTLGEVLNLNSGVSMVSVCWRFCDQHNDLIYSATTRYVVRHNDHTIMTVVLVDEPERLAKLSMSMS